MLRGVFVMLGGSDGLLQLGRNYRLIQIHIRYCIEGGIRGNCQDQDLVPGRRT